MNEYGPCAFKNCTNDATHTEDVGINLSANVCDEHRRDDLRDLREIFDRTGWKDKYTVVRGPDSPSGSSEYDHIDLWLGVQGVEGSSCFCFARDPQTGEIWLMDSYTGNKPQAEYLKEKGEQRN